MKGIVNIEIYSERLTYKFSIRHKVNVISGQSGVGKTTMCELFQTPGASIVAKFDNGEKCVVEYRNEFDVIDAISRRRNTVHVLDEIPHIFTKEFAVAVKESDGYFIIMSRRSMPEIPYSVSAMFSLRTSKRIFSNTEEFDTTTIMLCDNSSVPISNGVLIDCIVHEDSEDSTANNMYSHGFNQKVIDSSSNSKIAKVVIDATEGNVLCIVDGAAFGCCIESLRKRIRDNVNGRFVGVLYPESFEELLLTSEIFKLTTEQRAKVNTPYNFCDSKDFNSFEQYFEKLLHEVSSEAGFPYSKTKPREFYLGVKNVNKVIAAVKELAGETVIL